MNRCAVVSLVLLLLGSLSPAGAATVDVTSYGAVVNDGASDSSAISDAIDDLTSGSTLWFPAGRFHLTSQVDLPGHITMTGAGAGVTTLTWASVTTASMIRISDVSYTEVSHLGIDANFTARASDGIIAVRCTNLFLHHLAIVNFAEDFVFGPHGIRMSGTTDSTIADNYLYYMAPADEWGAAIRAGWGSERCQMLRNRIDYTGRGGVFTNNDSTDCIVRDNVITRSGGIGFAIEIHSNSNRTLIEDNVVDHGLSIVSNQCAVRRNIVTDPTGTIRSYGIEGGGGDDGIVRDNIIDWSHQLGISVSGGSQHMIWAHNQFDHCISWGCQFQGPSDTNPIDRIYFYDNTFNHHIADHPEAKYKNQGHGFRFHGYSTNIVFEKCEFSYNDGVGVQFTGREGVDRLSFIESEFIGNAGRAILTVPGGDLEWTSNTVTGNSDDSEPASRGFSDLPPIAAFRFERVGESVTTCQFTNESTPGEGAIDHVLWDFSEGLGVTDTNPTFTFPRPGIYRVILVVWNTAGRADLSEETVVALPEAEASAWNVFR